MGVLKVVVAVGQLGSALQGKVKVHVVTDTGGEKIEVFIVHHVTDTRIPVTLSKIIAAVGGHLHLKYELTAAVITM